MADTTTKRSAGGVKMTINGLKITVTGPSSVLGQLCTVGTMQQIMAALRPLAATAEFDGKGVKQIIMTANLGAKAADIAPGVERWFKDRGFTFEEASTS